MVSVVWLLVCRFKIPPKDKYTQYQLPRQSRNHVSYLEPVERCCGVGGWILIYSFKFSQYHSVQGLRAQIDRKLYKKHMQELLLDYPNLDVRAASVHDLLWSQPSASCDFGQSSPVEPKVWAQVAGVRLGKVNLIFRTKH